MTKHIRMRDGSKSRVAMQEYGVCSSGAEIYCVVLRFTIRRLGKIEVQSGGLRWNREGWSKW